MSHKSDLLNILMDLPQARRSEAEALIQNVLDEHVRLLSILAHEKGPIAAQKALTGLFQGQLAIDFATEIANKVLATVFPPVTEESL